MSGDDLVFKKYIVYLIFSFMSFIVGWITLGKVRKQYYQVDSLRRAKT